MSTLDKKKMSYFFSVISGATPDRDIPEYWDGDINWATPQDISEIDGKWLTETHRKLSKAGRESCGGTLAPPGAIFLAKRGRIGELAIIARAACANKSCLMLIPRHEMDARFFYYWFRTQTNYLHAWARGATIKELNADDLKALKVTAPNLQNQRAIADYLDREVAHLDALVLAKQRWLKLLAEKHLALITQAVTRGLDADVTLCDSGIAWLGCIPKHWSVERALRLFRERNERSRTGEEEILTNSYFTGAAPQFGKEVRRFAASTTADSKICRQGDLVLNTRRSWMGAMGVSGRLGLVSPAFHVYKPESRFDTGFIEALVQLPIFAQELKRQSKGDLSSGLRLYPENFFMVNLPVPPLQEQKAIATYVAAKTAKVGALQVATKRTISLLLERRAAMIAAAVTGQIKVEAAA